MKRKFLYLVLAIQALVLIGMYSFYAHGLVGKTYLLKAHRVDPRDFFRGDYVILNYDINESPQDFKRTSSSDTVYVHLKQEGKFWVIDNVSYYAPYPKDMVYLQARLTPEGRLLYDIEKYFVPEGKGNPPGEITVDVTIRSQGRAQIKQVYSDNKPWP